MPTARKTLISRRTKNDDAVSLQNSTDWENDDCCDSKVARKRNIRKPKRLLQQKRKAATNYSNSDETEFSFNVQPAPQQPRLLRQLTLGVDALASKEILEQTETLRYRNQAKTQTYRFLCYPESILEMPEQLLSMRHQPEFDFDVGTDDEQIEESIANAVVSLKEATERYRKVDQEEYE